MKYYDFDRDIFKVARRVRNFSSAIFKMVSSEVI
jgi:hypothetical protein